MALNLNLNSWRVLGSADRNGGLCPHYGHSRTPPGSAQLGGYLPLAPGVLTVRYPICERIFDDVSTVQSATDETWQKRKLKRVQPDPRAFQTKLCANNQNWRLHGLRPSN